MEIVDSTGAKYVVVGASKRGYPGPLFGFSLLCERVMTVEFDLRDTGERLSADEIRSLLPDVLDKAFSRASDDNFDKDEAEQALSDARSVAEVFDAYSRYLGLNK